MTWAAVFGGRRFRATFWARLPPGTNSREKNGIASTSPTSNTWTMFGCCIWATARASASNRSRAVVPAWSALSITLTATSRLSFRCRALYTTPMPPRPSSPSISYPGRRPTPRWAGAGGRSASGVWSDVSDGAGPRGRSRVSMPDTLGVAPLGGGAARPAWSGV